MFQTKLDLSLCTVGTLSAFLQTADNICLLTCTVTCRTLLPHPARPPPVCPIPPSSSRLRSTNPVPSPQAASSQCKLKLHFILSRLDWPDSVFLLFIIGLALNVFYFPFYVIKFYVKKKKKLAADTGAAQRSFGETQKVAVVDKNALKWDCWWDLARCDSQLFCDALLVWPVLLSECKKKKSGGGAVCQQHESQSRISLGIRVPRSGLRSSFVFRWLVHLSVCAVVLLLVFLEEGWVC